MTGLREHFATQADEAKYYDVANSVIRVARRRQRLVRLAPVGVAVAVALAVVAAWVPLAGGPSGDGPPGIDAAGPAETGGVDWIPERWDVPDAAPPLPADQPVGAGALVHTPCATLDESCTTFFLLTRDGAQYKAGDGGRASLSPDGRWLVSGPDSARTLRDLTGTTTRPLPGGVVVAWSPDNRLLVLEPNVPGTNPASVTVVALASGQSHEVSIRDPDDWAVRGIFPSGELLLAPRRDHDPDEGSTGTPMPSLTGPYRPNGEPPGFFLAVADGNTGAQRGLDVPMDNGILGKGDELSTGPAMPLLVAPSGKTLVYQLVRPRFDGSGDLLTISAAGQVLDRYRLPSGRGAASRELAAVRADGAVLITRTGNVITVEVLDLTSGRRMVVATAPAGSHLQLAGTTSWY